MDFDFKTVGIVGLGLIGGSFAKAYKAAGFTVYAYNRNTSVSSFAMLAGDIDGVLDEKTLPLCDIVILALYPEAVIKYGQDHASQFKKGALIMDACGTKEQVCRALFPIANANGFTFVGMHPMAGTHYSGYKYSKENMFKGAPVVIVPEDNDINIISRAKEALLPTKFGKLTVTTAENHDRMIAFTSQLAHVVSNAYIKSPTAKQRSGFSAGSYADLTRVAWLNEDMWTELFLENRENLSFELGTIIDSLTAYKQALDNGDGAALRSLLHDGKILKEEDMSRK